MLALFFLIWIATLVVIFEVMTLRVLYDAQKRRKLLSKFEEVVKDWTGN